MGKNPNPRRRSLSLSVLLFAAFTWCGLAGDVDAGGGAGLQTSDTFGVGERISTILGRLANGASGLGVIVRVGGGQAVLGECSSRGGSGWRG